VIILDEEQHITATSRNEKKFKVCKRITVATILLNQNINKTLAGG
jgi:hypothetical protein